MPPEGAGPLSVTVPVEEAPPRTVEGESDKLVGVGGVIVRVALADEVLADAVITAETEDDTARVDMVKVAVVA